MLFALLSHNHRNWSASLAAAHVVHAGGHFYHGAVIYLRHTHHHLPGEVYHFDAVDDYMEFHDELDRFEEAYCGEWDSEEDFARHIVSEYYDLERTMGGLERYFDYEAIAWELFMYDYSMGANNNVFRNI